MLDVPKKVLLPHGANFDDDGCRRWRGTTQTPRCLFPGKSHFVCVIISSHQPELFPPFFRPPQTSTSALTLCTCIPTCWICLEPPPPPPPPPTLPPSPPSERNRQAAAPGAARRRAPRCPRSAWPAARAPPAGPACCGQGRGRGSRGVGDADGEQ